MIDSAGKQEGTVLITVGTHLKVQFDSCKKHPLYREVNAPLFLKLLQC